MTSIGTLDFKAICEGHDPAGIPRANVVEFRLHTRRAEEVAEKLSQLATAQLGSPISSPLKEGDIPPEVKSNRTWVVKIYNQLREEDNLAILHRPTDELFDYQGNYDFQAHPALQAIAKEYMDQTHLRGKTFTYPLSYVQALKNGLLSDLKTLALSEDKERYDKWIHDDKERMQKKYDAYHSAMRVIGKTSDDFAEGDFGFILHADTRRYFSNAYKALTEANQWEALAQEYPQEHPAFLQACKDNGLSETMAKLEALDQHSQNSIVYVMRNMHQLKRVGWKPFVEKLWR